MHIHRKDGTIMSNLRCSVTSCGHNCDLLCTLSSIKVQGQNADKSQLTFCHSFVPRQTAGNTRTENLRGCETPACEETHIACDAVTCAYNKNNVCEAKHVDVCGARASSCTDTECATFRLDPSQTR